MKRVGLLIRAFARVLCVGAIPVVSVQAQWSAPGTVYRISVERRWMNARQTPRFTPWRGDQSDLHLDAVPQGMPLKIPASIALDIVPEVQLSRFAAGQRWTEEIDRTSAHDSTRSTLRGTRTSRVLRDTMVAGTKYWIIRDSLRGTYQETEKQHERTLRGWVTMTRDTRGSLVGQYLYDPASRTVLTRTDSAKFQGNAVLQYPDARVFRTTTIFEQTCVLQAYAGAAFAALKKAEADARPPFSMFIFPGTPIARRLKEGDHALRDSLLLAMDQSLDVRERAQLAATLEEWAGDREFVDTIFAHRLRAGDTAGVVSRWFDPASTPLTNERLSVLLPFVRDPGIAFSWGISAGEFYEDVEQRLSEYPPVVGQPEYRTVCTPSACATLAGQYDQKVDPRLQHVGLMTAFAVDPKRWVSAVRADTLRSDLRNLLDGIGATWSASSHPHMPAQGAGWAAWAEWMNGVPLPDSIAFGGKGLPSFRFDESHANAATFYGLLNNRDLLAEWQQGESRAATPLEHLVFETMLMNRQVWRPTTDSVAAWLMDGTKIGHTRGTLGAIVVMETATIPDSAMVTMLTDRILAHVIDGEKPWPSLLTEERLQPVGSMLDNSTRPDQGLAGQPPQTIYVKTEIITPELRAKWGSRVVWIADTEWRLKEAQYPATLVTITGLRANGMLASIGANIFSARQGSKGIDAGEASEFFLLLRTPQGWRIVEVSVGMV